MPSTSGRRVRYVRAICLGLIVAAGGCFGRGQEQRVESSSGDPEADKRAEARIGSEGDGSRSASQPQRTLYERLGGGETIAALVDDMVLRAMNDPRVNFQREDVKTSWIGTKYKPWDGTPEAVSQLKLHFIEFLTLASGGPAHYSGRPMREVHEGMRISNAEFDAMIGDIKTSMDRIGLGKNEKRDLLAVLETTRKEIVEKQ